MAEYTVDTLQIEVEDVSSGATDNIDRLAEKLRALKEAVNGSGNGLTTLSKRLQALRDSTQGLASASSKLGNLATALKSMSGMKDISIPASLPKRLEEIGTAVESITPEARQNLDDMTRSIQRLSGLNLTGLPRALRSAGTMQPVTDIAIQPTNISLAGTASEISALTEEFQQLGAVSQNAVTGAKDRLSQLEVEIRAAKTEYNDLLTLLAEKRNVTSVDIQSLTQTRDRLNELNSEYRRLNNEVTPKVNTKDIRAASREASKLSKILSSIGRIAFYRAVRTGLKMVTDAFSTGVNDLYQYSKLLGSDFAGSMDSLATSALYLKNSLGAMVSPLIETLAPAVDFVVDEFVSLLNVANQVFSALAGKSTYTMATKQATEYADAASDAASATKKFLLGIDELNTLDSRTSSSASTSVDYSTMFEEAAISSDIMDLSEKLKPVLETAGLIGAALLAWNISDGLITKLGLAKVALSGIAANSNLTVTIALKAGLFAAFLGDVLELKRFIEDIKDNGADLSNVTGVISEISGAIGDLALLSGNVGLGGVLKMVQGVGEIVSAASDIAKNGFDEGNVLQAVRGVGNVVIAIGALNKDPTVLGVGLVITGLTGIIREISENWDAIKQGDWSGVDKASLAISAITLIGGVITALGVLKNIKGISDISSAATTVTSAANATSNVSAATSGLSTSLTNLAKDLGTGLVIVLEVSAAAVIIAGAIAVLGMELEKVGSAWDPVIDNGGTVAVAMGIGVGVLAAVGVVTGALGTVGTPLIVNIGVGTGVLAELGIAAGLFVAEIWAIGKGLDEIGQAWGPVLENGDTIATGIEAGTALLVGVGAAAAALGIASIASVGLLPVAIGVGTGVLVELAGAFVAFTESMVGVADEIGNELSPALNRLNPKLPKLKTNMSEFTDYMAGFADEVSNYTQSMGSVTWSSIVSGFQKLFSGNPIQDLADDVSDIADDTKALNKNLTLANPELQTAITLMESYSALMSRLNILTSENGATTLGSGMYTNLKSVGEKLATGFSDGINGKASLATASVQNVYDTTVSKLQSLAGGTTFKTEGEQLMTGLANGLTSGKSKVTTPFKSLLNDLALLFETFMGRTTTALNTLLSDYAKTVSSVKISSTGSVTYNKASAVKIQQFAAGGYPEQGQIFIAGEAGPELVGRIGSKTAVANNDQIVQGVADGVESANESVVNAIYAMAAQIVAAVNANGGDVYLDGTRVGSKTTGVQNRQNRMYGKTLQNT